MKAREFLTSEFLMPDSRPLIPDLSFAGLVVLARSLNPIPSRTRPLNSSAPMVLWLKPWESRSLPGLPRTRKSPLTYDDQKRRFLTGSGAFFVRRRTNRDGDLTRRSCFVVATRAIFGHDVPLIALPG